MRLDKPFALRQGSAEQWEGTNPVLADGEPAIEDDTGLQKIGDGVKRYNDLPYNTVSLGQLGVPGGIASLDSGRKVPGSQLPLLVQHGRTYCLSDKPVLVSFPGPFEGTPAVIANVQSKADATAFRAVSMNATDETLELDLRSAATTPTRVDWLAIGRGEPAPPWPAEGTPDQPTAVLVSKDDANRTGTISWQPPIHSGAAAPPPGPVMPTFTAGTPVGSTEAGGSLTTQVVSLPPGLVAGDVTMLFVSHIATGTPAITMDADWTLLGTQQQSDAASGSTGLHGAIFYNTYAAGDPATVTITSTVAGRWSVLPVRVRGQRATTPFVGISYTKTTSATATITAPTQSPTEQAVLLSAFFARSGAAPVVLGMSSTTAGTEIGEAASSTTTTTNSTVAAYAQTVPAGATGTRTVTTSGGNSTGAFGASLVVYAAPAPPASADSITGYRVSRNGTDASGKGAYSTVVSATTRTFTMTNLAEGTYRLTVAAVNHIGTGPIAFGDITVTVAPPPPPPPPGTPTAPTAVVATKDDTVNSGTITWGVPTSDGGSPITGYRVARDGVDTTGIGAYSTTVAATVRTFTFTKLDPGSTYKFTVEAVTAVGTGAAGSGSVTLAEDPTGAVQKTGPEYVLEQTLTGDLHQKMNGHSLILSLQGQVYQESDFNRPYGSVGKVPRAGLTKAQIDDGLTGKEINPTAYLSAMYQGKTVKGVVGASMESTIIEVKPSSSTVNPDYKWGLDGVEGRETYGSNFLQLWAILDQPVDLVYKDFTLRGTPQHPVAGSPDGTPPPVNALGNGGQGHDYNGWYIARPKGNVYIENVKVMGIPGSGSSPPGETFIMSLLGVPAGKKATLKNLQVDGRRPDGVEVGSAGLGLNTVNGIIEVDGGRFDYMNYSASIAAWKISSTGRIILRNTRMVGMKRTLGAEALEGIIDVYDPVWGPVANTRFDINLTWARTSATRTYKNGRINFYFSSEQAWLNFKAARSTPHTIKNIGRTGFIRVVTNTREDYGHGRLPSGTYEDPWKCVLVWFKDPADGVYKQRPANNYIDFFGIHETTF